VAYTSVFKLTGSIKKGPAMAIDIRH